MSKPTKVETAKYKSILEKQLASLRGDVGSMKDEALRASDQDASVDHLADQGTDNYDQGFMLGLIENEEETIKLIEEALDRIAGNGEWDFGACPICEEELENSKPKKGKEPELRVYVLPRLREMALEQIAQKMAVNELVDAATLSLP